MSELTTKEVVGTCQVRSGTAGACSRPAAVELRGIPFCERCAREQQTYFAIGEFMEAEKSSDGERLAVVMDLMKQIRSRRRTLGEHEPDADAVFLAGFTLR